MPIVRVPRGTIRAQDDPLQRISMVSGLERVAPAFRKDYGEDDLLDFFRQKGKKEGKSETLIRRDYTEFLQRADREGAQAWRLFMQDPYYKNLSPEDKAKIQDRFMQESTESYQGKAFDEPPGGPSDKISFSPGEMVRLNALGRSAAEKAAFKPALSDKAARDELKLNPQELQMYGRHLKNLTGPGGVDHPDGRRSTLLNMGVEFDGKYYNLPRVYDGKILSRDDAIARARAEGLDKFPSYKTKEEAEARYDQLHKLMEKDAAQFFRRGPDQPMQERTAFPIEGMDVGGTGHSAGGAYGAQRSQGHHAGLDIPLKVGTPLRATDNGGVIKTGTDPGGYGHYIDVQLADGTVHRMGHLGTDDRSVNPYGTFKPGDTFKAGDTLAYSGRSAIKQSAPHVHYEVFPSRGMYDRSLTAGSSHENVNLRMDPIKYFSEGRDAAVKDNLARQVQAGEGGITGSKREVAQTVAKEFRAAGYTENAIAGILRNVDEESSFNPRSRHFDQPDYRGTEAENSHGLFQEGGAEYNNWMKWMREKHPDGHWTDPKIQAEWIASRVKSGYPDLHRTFTDPKTTKEGAADAFLRGYLRPAPDNVARRSAHYAKGIPGVEHYTGPTVPEVKVTPTAPAPPAPAAEAPPVAGPVEDPTIAARQRELSQRPAPGPEDPSIAARRLEMSQTSPTVGAPAGTALAPTMGDEDPSANPGVMDPSIVARQREMTTRQPPGIEDPSIVARQEEYRRAQGSAPITGTEPPGDFNIAVRPGGVGSDFVAGGGGGGGGGGGSSVTSALDSWRPGQPIMPAILSDIFGIGGGGGGGLFGGGGKMPKFQNLVTSYTPTPDTILPSAGPEPSGLPTTIPPPPPAPPPNPSVGPQQILARFQDVQRRHRRA